MIEIAIDENSGDEFLNKVRPVFNVDSFFGNSFDDYRRHAKDFFEQFAEERVVIVRINCDNFSLNAFAVALFVESYRKDIKMECVVFKVKDRYSALEAYKPFVALTIAIKYVVRLCKENAEYIYKEFTCLSYLDLKIKEDCVNDKLYLVHEGDTFGKKFEVKTLEEALIAVGIVKALALSHKELYMEIDIKKEKNASKLDEDGIICRVIEGVSPWIKM